MIESQDGRFYLSHQLVGNLNPTPSRYHYLTCKKNVLLRVTMNKGGGRALFGDDDTHPLPVVPVQRERHQPRDDRDDQGEEQRPVALKPGN